MLMYAELSESNAFILCPTEEGLFEKSKGDHSALVVWRHESDETTEDSQANPRDGCAWSV